MPWTLGNILAVKQQCCLQVINRNIVKSIKIYNEVQIIDFVNILHVQLFKMYSNTGPEFDAWPEASPSCEAFDVGEPVDVDILSEMTDQKIIEATNKNENKENSAAAIKGVKRKRQKKIKFSHKKRCTTLPVTCKSFGVI